VLTEQVQKPFRHLIGLSGRLRSVKVLPWIGVGHRRTLICARHRLLTSARTDDVVAIAGDLVALHSSDPVSVYLSATSACETPKWVSSTRRCTSGTGATRRYRR